MKKVILFFCFVFVVGKIQAQGKLLTSLSGNPMNTTGWNIVGNARVVDTNGDPDTDLDELLLVSNIPFNSGGIFYQKPINLSQCSNFEVDFEFRIFDGNGADGLAFCFIQNPPTGFVNGQGLGIPANANGLMIGFDTFDNCGGGNPELQIRYGLNYTECPTPPQPTALNQNYLRNNQYQKARIIYTNGSIQIFIDNILRLSGNYAANFTGYFGFTASTGQLFDNHSIKNVNIYVPIPNANAGLDATICSNDTIQLGVNPTVNTQYRWLNTIGIDNTAIANPMLTLSNTSNLPKSYAYVLRVDSTGTSCYQLDTVVITVNPEPQKPIINGELKYCPGENLKLEANTNGNAIFTWLAPNTNIFTGPIFTKTLLENDGGVYGCIANIGGCLSDTSFVTIQLCDSIIAEIPNVFTPNGDEINENWKGKFSGVKALNLEVFNRWGVKVYEKTLEVTPTFTETTIDLWKESHFEKGPFVYQIKITGALNQQKILKGFLRIL